MRTEIGFTYLINKNKLRDSQFYIEKYRVNGLCRC